jgi:hypothetical protein
MTTYQLDSIATLKEQAQIEAAKIPVSHNLAVVVFLEDNRIKACVSQDGDVSLSELVDDQWQPIAGA